MKTGSICLSFVLLFSTGADFSWAKGSTPSGPLFIDITHENLTSYTIDIEGGKCVKATGSSSDKYWFYDLIISLKDGKKLRRRQDETGMGSYTPWGSSCREAKAKAATVIPPVKWYIDTLEMIKRDTPIYQNEGSLHCSRMFLRSYSPTNENGSLRIYDFNTERQYIPVACPKLDP